MQTNNAPRSGHALGRAKGVAISLARRALIAWAYRGWLPPKLCDRLITRFWDNSAQDIHARWGHGREDYAVLEAIIKRYGIRSVFDAGCGSGRLFELYEHCGVTRIVGADISGAALQPARWASPRAELRLMRLENLDDPRGSFDLGVCNRVLQHVPERDIALAVGSLCRACCAIYVNELTDSDGQEEHYFVRRNDYPGLFAAHRRTILERGTVSRQTYLLFGSSSERSLFTPQEEPI